MNRVYALVGWLLAGGVALALCPLLWDLLTHQTTSSCYGLWDGVATERLMVMPMWIFARDPSLWPCVTPAILTPTLGLALVLRRPRGLRWLCVAAGWTSYPIVAVLLAGVGC